MDGSWRGEGWQWQFTEKVIAKHQALKGKQARVSTGQGPEHSCSVGESGGRGKVWSPQLREDWGETFKIQLCTLYYLLERLPASIRVQ